MWRWWRAVCTHRHTAAGRLICLPEMSVFMHRFTCLLLITFAAALFGALLPPTRAQAALTIGTLEPLVNLDPADADSFFEWEVLTHLYTGLTRQVPGTLTYELALAESHTASTDGLTHTFRIRPEAAFNDGTPITAQTFADSISRVLRLNGRAAAVITPYVRAAAVDETGALQLTLTKPLPFVWQLVALPPFFPVHPHSFPADRLNRQPGADSVHSNGIYRLSSVSFEAYTLTADAAWRGTPPQTPILTLRRYPNSAALREALKRGEIQVAWRGMALADGAALPAESFQTQQAPSLQVFYLVVGQRREPFNDLAARRVLSLGLNRERAVRDGLGGYGIPLETFTPINNADSPRYPTFDAEALRAALESSRYSRFNQIVSEVQTARLLYGDAALTAAARLFAETTTIDALRFVVQETEPRTFRDQIQRRAFRLLIIGWLPLVPHPHAYFEPLLTGELAVGADYDSTEAAALLAAAAQSNAYEQVEALALRDLVVIPLWQSVQTLHATEGVSGILIEPNFLLRYDHLVFN